MQILGVNERHEAVMVALEEGWVVMKTQVANDRAQH